MIDIVQLYEDYNIPYWTGGNNVSVGWVNVRCVMCHDTSNHLGYSLKEGYFSCWICGKHDEEVVIRRLLNLPSYSVSSIIQEYWVPSNSDIHQHRKEARAEQITLPGTDLSPYHKRYLEGRGFDPDLLVDKYQLKGTGPKDLWAGYDFKLRIIIPIIYNKRIVSFQGRDITDKQKARYKGCPVEKSIMNYKDILYNIDNAFAKQIIVVEGVTDVWRLGGGSVATFGTAVTPSQIKLLSRFETILFLFDPEEEAQRRAINCANALAGLGKNVEIVSIEKGVDVAALSDDEATQLKYELVGGM